MLQQRRVLHVFRAPAGGLFRHVRDLAAGQSAAGMSVGVVCDSEYNSPELEDHLARLKEICRLGVHRVPMRRLPALSDIRAVRAIRQIAGETEAQILHGHGAKGGAYARLAARQMGRDRPRTVYTPHGGSLHYSRLSVAGAAFLTMEQLLLPDTDLFLFVCRFEYDAFCAKIGQPRRAFSVAHNGVRADEIAPVEPDADAADLLFIGELRHLKGVDVLLAAMAALSERPTLSACIVGAGADRAALEARARRLGLSERVQFVGAMPARKAFRKGKLLVVPSRAESLPYIVLEALAAEVPIVASRVGGIPEILDGHEDLMVPAGKVDSLAAAIDDALNDLDRRRLVARRLSQRVAQRFSVDVMVDTISRSYDRLFTQTAAANAGLTAEPSAAVHS